MGTQTESCFNSSSFAKGSFSSRLYKGRASYGATSFTINVANFFCRDALPLLGPLFADPTVRSFAVSQLDKFTDEEMCIYMLQLTNSLRHEPYHDSALSLLIRRALRNPDIIGHVLYWVSPDPSLNDSFVRTRNTVIVTNIFDTLWNIHRLEFGRQLYLVSRLKDLSKRLVKSSPWIESGVILKLDYKS